MVTFVWMILGDRIRITWDYVEILTIRISIPRRIRSAQPMRSRDKLQPRARMIRTYSSCFQLKAPRKGLRIHYTDPAPFVFCEFCKSMHTNGNAPQGPEKQVYRNSEVRRSGVRCAAGCCIKSVKSVFRARARRAGAMRGRL